MRRILTGDLSNEVSVSYKESPEESFRNLSYPKTVKRPAPTDAMPSISLFGNPSILPKPPKLLKGGTNSITSLTQQSSPWPEKQNNSMSEFIGHSSFLPISPRKPGRPSTAGNLSRELSYSWILSKDVVLAVQYKVYLVKRVISLVDTVQYS